MSVPLFQIGAVLFQTVAAQAQAEAANAATEFNARILEENAAIADVAAAEELGIGVKEENILRFQSRQFKGKQRAVFATSGALVDSGSTLDVLAGTERITEIDALTIRENALKRARTLTQRGTGFLKRATLSRLGKVDPGVVATTTLLTGTSRLITQFSQQAKGLAGAF